MGLDTVIFENHEIEAFDSVDNNGEGARDTMTEQLIEQNTGELSNNELQMLVETEQPLDNSIQEKSDEVQAESGANDETAESYNDGGAEGGDISFEPQVDSESQQSIPTILRWRRPSSLLRKRILIRQAQFESDIENVESGEHSNMEDIESRDVSVVEMNVELSKEDAMKGIQEDLVVPTEEAPKVDDVGSSTEIIMEDLGEAPPASPIGSHVTSDGDGKQIESSFSVAYEWW